MEIERNRLAVHHAAARLLIDANAEIALSEVPDSDSLILPEE